MLVMMPSGTDFCLADRCGIHFWGVHSHDSMWHLEIANVAFLTFPFQVPTFSGGVLSGYNILMDIVLYGFSLIGIPSIITLFKIVPIVWFFFYTLLTISFARKIRDTKQFILLSLFFVYFAGHLGYFLQLYHDGSIFKGSQSFSLQSMTSLLNTQFALTLPMILAQLALLKSKSRSLISVITMGVLTFFIFGLKFYGGVISSLILFFYLLDWMIEKKTITKLIKPVIMFFLFTSASIILFYNPFQASQTGSIFIFSPFAIVHSMIEAPNMVYLRDMVNARYYLYEQGWSPRLLYIELLSTFLYVFFNFGVRFIGIIYIFIRALVRRTRFEMYLLGLVFASIALSVLLIQKGDWWNTVQFGYYGIFISNFMIVIMLDDMIRTFGKKSLIIVISIIILAFPATLQTVNAFTKSDTLYISRQELQAMKYLKNKPDGVVFNSFLATDGYSFLDYRTSGYVAAFTDKQVYFGHMGPLNIIGVPFRERWEAIKNNECDVFTNVDYIYYVKGHDDTILNECDTNLIQKFEQGFENNEVIIYQKK
ncbi:hypothetical protein COY16_03240 [Candidatus Roizmanbacteria bacterium CG_4_10_14_0_2_um_filter_39_13]|uniref:Uncharacterized protein n=1 Tax=Candidatus Roizmanbacteria bacterium CG_4_10_14_0_2_um_filter_39_13 TaxID=1974825 RepID=A0A2M7TZ55_9BACT|nr:MAG: hypothetical protein COY16_03240 [Candidatus Roizmanbacteria bacterium CG_4_10_14_0_2_um_filter_39_13]